MKTSDIALVIFIAALSVILSAWIGSMVLGNPSERFETVTYAHEISSSVTEPDIEIFNPYAKNPSYEVYYGICPAGQTWDTKNLICKEASGGSSLNPQPEPEVTPNPENPENPETPTE